MPSVVKLLDRSIPVETFRFLCAIFIVICPHPAVSQDAPDPVVVLTSFFEVHLSPTGAVPVRWDLLASRFEPGAGLRPDADPDADRVRLYDGGLLGLNAGRPLELVIHGTVDTSTDLDFNTALYTVTRHSEGGEDSVTFESPISSRGLKIIKTYRFVRDDFQVRFSLRLVNTGPEAIRIGDLERGLGIALGPGLGYAPSRPGDFSIDGGGLNSYTWPILKTARGIDHLVLTEPEEGVTVVAEEAPIEWAGLHNHYFMMTLIPDPQSPSPSGLVEVNATLSQALVDANFAGKDDLRYYPRIEIFGAPLRVGAGEAVELSYLLFVGPKDREVLAEAGHDLDGVVLHHLWRWMAALCRLFEWILGGFNAVTHNWGLSIILLAVGLRVLLFPLSMKAIQHQKRAKVNTERVKPLVAEIKKKYKDDALERNQRILDVHKAHGLNPGAQLMGSMPLLIQLPILIALYHLLSNSYDLRGVTFLWIHDMSEADKLFPLGISLPWLGAYFNLLPVTMFAAQVVVALRMETEANSKAAGPMKARKSIYILPIIMLLLFYPFPAGCMLYWTTTNVAQILEQRLRR